MKWHSRLRSIFLNQWNTVWSGSNWIMLTYFNVRGLTLGIEWISDYLSTGHRFDADTPIAETVRNDISLSDDLWWTINADASPSRRGTSGVRSIHRNVLLLGVAMYAEIVFFIFKKPLISHSVHAMQSELDLSQRSQQELTQWHRLRHSEQTHTLHFNAESLQPRLPRRRKGDVPHAETSRRRIHSMVASRPWVSHKAN